MNSASYVYREKSGSGAEAPLLFLFHGTGGDEDQLFDLGVRVSPDAQLISVRGDVSEYGALRFFRRLGEGRYDMADLASRTEKLSGFIEAHVGNRGQRSVYGLGYSNGANILASVLFTSPALFDAAVLMHPLIPFTPPAAPGLAGKRLLLTAGRHDPIAPAAATEALARYFESQGAHATIDWHEGGHELRPQEISAARALLTPTPAVA